MKLTAAPVVRQPMDVIGAPGKTDFTRIYIASELNKDEYRTVLRHEQAHVWAFHAKRAPEEVNHRLWNIACDVEIARVVYDKRDIATITSPRSRIKGGILPDSIDGLPVNILLAEEIYQWLLDNSPHQDADQSMCDTDASKSADDGSNVEQQDVPAAASNARSQLDKDEKEEQSQIAAASLYRAILNRPPTLTDEVDAALRIRVQREHSYRRPSRRHGGSNLIMPGAISTPRPPLVEIFVDRSGSFTPQKTSTAEQQLKILLSRYGSTIQADVWFFGNGKLMPSDPGGGGDTPYHLVAQHLALTMPKLAIVITDDDPVHESVTPITFGTKVLCVPIECNSTILASSIGGVDVVTR